MSGLIISKPSNPKDTEDLDSLLWEILWKPLSLPKNIHDKFKLTGETIELVAKSDWILIGGLVANWISPIDIEIRHIAVNPGSQRIDVGKGLVHALAESISIKGCERITTIARNTSVNFFSKLGFNIIREKKPADHPDFLKHGITFEFMEKTLTKKGNL
jgi:ribosomal protein S18 acetylase RimI-like enzyme